MNNANHLLNYLSDLRLQRMGEEEEAGLWISSLPWPRAASQKVALESHPTFVKALGQWPGKTQPCPRRLLLFADGKNTAPNQISLSSGASETTPTEMPTAEMELFERSPHPEYIWERHLLRLKQGSRSVGLAMGLRTKGKVHWWEACRLVVLESTPDCLIVEMGGAIPHVHMSLEELKSYPGLTNPFLHRHNWLNGHLYVRLHRNGVCEVFAHHINSKFFDDGLHLEDAVPVIGFATDTAHADIEPLCGEWTGQHSELELDGVRFDMRELSRLATPMQPGNLHWDGSFLVLQPYTGMELFGGICPTQLEGDTYIFRAEQKIIPRGMARTLRFSLSLSDRSPRIARYLAPAWWYGVCEEFLPQSVLPVSNVYDETWQQASRWMKEHIWCGGFEDGSVPRHTHLTRQGGARDEPGWEGEISYGQFLAAWRTGDEEAYATALRSAYHFTDVAVDHAARAVRMHGYPPHAFSVPMNRVMGTLAAFLETGDPYLLETAQSVTANSHYSHKNSWPRLAVGRDACYVRGAVLLYRYFADDYFRQIAYEGAMSVAHSQRPNGSFGDQGGGTGLHQWGGYITKPWMGLMALGGVLDYLELFPDELPLENAVKKFADWLLAERQEPEGRLVWSYQHDFDGQRRFYDPFRDVEVTLPAPPGWHQESLARLMGYSTRRFGNPDYLAAWAQSHQGKQADADHAVSTALQFLPWLQAKLWCAALTSEGIQTQPLDFGPLTPKNAQILAPTGAIFTERDG